MMAPKRSDVGLLKGLVERVETHTGGYSRPVYHMVQRSLNMITSLSLYNLSRFAVKCLKYSGS